LTLTESLSTYQPSIILSIFTIDLMLYRMMLINSCAMLCDGSDPQVLCEDAIQHLKLTAWMQCDVILADD